MSKLTDEILNRYIDNELDQSELAEVKSELENNEEALTHLRALRAVDNSLNQIEIESAPLHITEKIMKALVEKSNAAKPKVSYFFVSVFSAFIIGIIAVLIAAFRMSDNGKNILPDVPTFNFIKDFFNKKVVTLHTFFSDQNVLLVVSIFTLLLFVTVYFTFESHKNFKNKLNNVLH